jgi:hypothetical protein
MNLGELALWAVWIALATPMFGRIVYPAGWTDDYFCHLFFGLFAQLVTGAALFGMTAFIVKIFT